MTQPGARPVRTLLLALSILLAGGLAGCSTTQYYWQAVRGHVDLMQRRRPVAQVIADPATPARLRDTLRSLARIRDFAVSDLGLPDNGSYRSYAALDRPYVIWNVFAAPALSLDPREWCFLVAGCVTYRGYFAKQDAEALAAELRAEGLDVYIGGVPAYSTLGWLDDPLLSTFTHWPEVELARLVFHELAHQRVYLKGDSGFNESFATAVEEVGVARWIAHEQRPELSQDWAVSQQHREGFLHLLQGARDDLASLYAGPGSAADKRAGKTARLARLQQDYLTLKLSWEGFSGYDRWFAQGVNNAQLASVAIYTAQVPGFLGLLADAGGDLSRFYQRVAGLARLGASARNAALDDAAARHPDALATKPGDAGAHAISPARPGPHG